VYLYFNFYKQTGGNCQLTRDCKQSKIAAGEILSIVPPKFAIVNKASSSSSTTTTVVVAVVVVVVAAAAVVVVG